nr:MAG TPA: hypothetical protein [Bacteriophage sp.]
MYLVPTDNFLEQHYGILRYFLEYPGQYCHQT